MLQEPGPLARPRQPPEITAKLGRGEIRIVPMGAITSTYSRRGTALIMRAGKPGVSGRRFRRPAGLWVSKFDQKKTRDGAPPRGSQLAAIN